MAGKRGGARPGAGAKPIAAQVCRIADIQRCWDVVMEFVKSDAPLAQRAEMASKIAVKAVPQNVNLGGQEDNPLNNVFTFKWMD